MKNRLTVLFACMAFAAQAQVYTPDWESIDSRPVPGWFEDAKFGIFIHWGLYAVPAWAPTGQYSEWYWWQKDFAKNQAFVDFHNEMYGAEFRYQDFVKDFKAEMFRPEEWAATFRGAGAKYVVLTSKHHEGYALWPSQYSWNWNSVDTGPHRDICGELTGAVRAEGLHMGFYYSLYEWFNPVFLTDVDRYVDRHMLPQMKELVVRYEPDIVWTDGEWEYPSATWRSAEFLAWLYNESPVADRVAVNDRWGKETRGVHGGYYTTEYDESHWVGGEAGAIAHRPWEECRGIGGSFGYNRNENLEDYSTDAELIHMLINKTARGGNLLLNVGPTADGRIPVIQQQRLAAIGEWLAVNGEAIYGTRKWDKAPDVTAETTLYFTKKGGDIYAIVTSWSDKPLKIGGITRAKSVKMLGTDKKIQYKLSGGVLTITPPQLSPAENPCSHAWVYKITGAE